VSRYGDATALYPNVSEWYIRISGSQRFFPKILDLIYTSLIPQPMPLRTNIPTMDAGPSRDMSKASSSKLRKTISQPTPKRPKLNDDPQSSSENESSDNDFNDIPSDVSADTEDEIEASKQLKHKRKPQSIISLSS
jgi:hypothetical protein